MYDVAQCPGCERADGVSLLRPFSLVSLPVHYNDLFQKAAFAKCPRKGVAPKFSVICLICGRYLCMACCEDRKTLTAHSKECNNGFCAFLWLQKTKIIIIWGTLAAQFKSVYLDKYGEENYGLTRRNRVSLNEARYKELRRLITEHKIPNKVNTVDPFHSSGRPGLSSELGGLKEISLTKALNSRNDQRCSFVSLVKADPIEKDEP